MQAHVITCNDFPVYVVIDDRSRAESRMEEMIANQMRAFLFTNREEYDKLFDWTVRTVKAEGPAPRRLMAVKVIRRRK